MRAARPDGLRLRLPLCGHFNVHGLDLALGVEERDQLGPRHVRLHQGEHLPGFHAGPEGGRNAPGGGRSWPAIWGVTAALLPERMATTPARRSCSVTGRWCTGSVFRQDFPLLFFEKRDAFRLWRLRGVQRLRVRGEDHHRR